MLDKPRIIPLPFRPKGPLRISRESNAVRVSPDADWQVERQAHPAQLLAELAKHGVSLEQELTTQARVFAVADILRDTIANYNSHERQIEWIGMAFALYLPPHKTWIDKFGHRFSFDDLADELLGRDLDSPTLSCAGTHVLEALVVVLRVDADHFLLSEANRARVRQYINGHVDHLARIQSADGSWSKKWAQERMAVVGSADVDASRHERVHVTGHHLDWMLLLPPEMAPPEDLFRRAAAWLLACLLQCDEKDIVSNYCPYSHAAHILLAIGPGHAPCSR